MPNNIQPAIITVVILSLLLIPFSAGFCQSTDKWQKKNDKGNRYEGSISEEVSSAPTLKLISFYSFKEEYNRNSILRVMFYLHKSSLNVDLNARELENREFYWMEAKPRKWQFGWNEFGPWPVNEVLLRLNISSENLGILVRLCEKKFDCEKESGLLAPAVFYHSSPPPQINHYTAFFRADKPLSEIEYEIYKQCEGDELLVEDKIGSQSPGMPFPIKFDLSKNWEGLARLKVICIIKNDLHSVPPVYEYFFYHFPIIKE